MAKQIITGHKVNIIQDILDERARQDKMYPNDLYMSDKTWMIILTEEIGEVAKAIMENEYKDRDKELIEVAAVCMAWLEDIKRRQDQITI